MATTSKKATESVDYSMEEKIAALYDLQKIDSKIDEINKLKGELPLEVQDLEDEVAGLQTRIENINKEVEELNLLTKQRKEEIEQSKTLIAKYDEQIKNVRNNREYDSLTKEIEFQTLEIELNEKRLKEYAVEIATKKAMAEGAETSRAERMIDLEQKRGELQTIDKETASEVEALKKEEVVAREKIDDRLLAAYNRIRGNVRNGLAVVTVKRDACGGCFNRIPPQRQAEIRLNRKVIVCEYCGRILVSDESNEE
ncbi:C4-type zinc ribbon domain-containing protein [Alistipes sp. OttesenSCG-928-B03]|nr:C4-type zinc ribbon domain-containing protein [Alistipes sp. OttesenSCG-928-B03]